MRILCVYAHPDDESFGPAALLARYAREGASLYGLFFTRGEHGRPVLEPAPPPEELARLREQDLTEAAALIGFYHVDVLDYEDGSLARVPPAILQSRVLDSILAYRPEVLLTFGPAGISRHPDHVAVHEAATAAFHRAREHELNVQELFYDAVPPEAAREMKIADVPDGQPNTWIDVTDTLTVKLEALRLHGRHVQDARDFVQETSSRALAASPLHRAWPPVPPGMILNGFLQDPLS